MKKSNYKSILVLYIVMLLLSLAILLAGVFLIYGLVNITSPTGEQVLSNWPANYTEDFAQHIELDGEAPAISSSGQATLNENNVWLQIIDEDGTVLFSYGTDSSFPAHYSPSEFLELYRGEHHEESVFINAVELEGQEYSYVMGFPVNIEKVTMYLNGDRFTGGKSIILVLVAIGALLMIVSGGVLGVWVSRHLRRIIQSVGLISSRIYEPEHRTGVFGEVYDSLNEMNEQLRTSDAELTRTEKTREEWLTNITHDLKTPLSPIKGYAELLADTNSKIPENTRAEYGAIIVKNAGFAETLVNDLKLTYQLKNNMIPLDKKHANLTRFVKETVIEILNNPDNINRTIQFSETAPQEVCFSFDEKLLKRAINNVIGNALAHNPTDTKVLVDLQVDESIKIIIEDDGQGMDGEEIARLFERYYRGTNTETKTDGTGLGMAIVKQIVEAHGGEIEVLSQKGAGTKISFIFPAN